MKSLLTYVTKFPAHVIVLQLKFNHSAVIKVTMSSQDFKFLQKHVVLSFLFLVTMNPERTNASCLVVPVLKDRSHCAVPDKNPVIMSYN
jgi:hypothetical protein